MQHLWLIIVFAGLIPVLSTVLLFIMLRKYYPKNSPVRKLSPTDVQLLPEKTCPQCHTKMETGFIFSARGMAWRSREDTLAGRKSWGELMANTMQTGFATSRNIAWVCHRCKLAMFDYSAQVTIKKQQGTTI